MSSLESTEPPRRKVKILACRTGPDATTVILQKEPMIESVSSCYTPPPPPPPPRQQQPKPVATLLFSRRYGRDLITKVGKRPVSYYDVATPTPIKKEEGESTASPSSPKRRKTGKSTRVDTYVTERDAVISRVVENLMTAGPKKCVGCGRSEFVPSKETGMMTCTDCGVVTREYHDSALDYRSPFESAMPAPGDRAFSHSDATDMMIHALERAKKVIVPTSDIKHERKEARVGSVLGSASASTTESRRVLSLMKDANAVSSKPSTVAGYTLVSSQQTESGQTAQQCADRFGLSLKQTRKGQRRVLNTARTALALTLQQATSEATLSASGSVSHDTQRSIEALSSVVKSGLNAAKSQVDTIVSQCFPSLKSSDTSALITTIQYVLDRIRDLDLLRNIKSHTKTVAALWISVNYHPKRTTTFAISWERLETEFHLKKKTLWKHIAVLVDARFMIFPILDASPKQLRSDFLRVCKDKENVSEDVMSQCLQARSQFSIPFYATYLEVRNRAFG